MKKKLMLFTLVLALFVSMVSVPVSASAENLPTYDYMILADAVYESSKSSTLAKELAAAQSRKVLKVKPLKANETFSDKDEKRMVDNWIKFSYNEAKTVGFTASSYYNPTRNEVVIAFAGTDEIFKDWVGVVATSNILTLMTKRSHDQKKFAEGYAMNTANSIGAKSGTIPRATYINPKTKQKSDIKSDAKIIMTGHSLGGYLVQAAGMHLMCCDSTAKKFKAGVTFNALGMAVKTDLSSSQKKAYSQGKYNKFAHYSVSWEFVGNYNKDSGRVLIGGPNSHYVKPIKGKVSDGFYNHKLKGLYYHFN